MKNRTIKTALCILLSLFIIFSTMSVASAEEKVIPQDDSAYTSLKTPEGRPLCVAKYGDTENYPENSLEGISSAVKMGVDMVYVSVKKTADNYIVLLADDSLNRMCVDALGNSTEKNISEIGYHELSTYHLRNSSGYLHESITAYTVPTLQAVVESLEGETMLLIDGGWEFRDEIYDILVNANALSRAVILASGDKKEVSAWLAGKETMPLVIASTHGNGSAKSYVSKTLSAGAVGVLLTAKNPYSFVFKNGVMKKFQDAGRAVVDMTDPKLCGGLEDNVIGWNMMASRGATVLITKNPQGLMSYYARVSAYREILANEIVKAQNIDTTLCSTKSANDLKKAITKAKATYISNYSEMELMQAEYDLHLAVESLTNQTDEVEGTTITKGRIIAVVSVVAGLILIEILFDVFRRKKVAKRRAIARRAEQEKNNK